MSNTNIPTPNLNLADDNERKGAGQPKRTLSSRQRPSHTVNQNLMPVTPKSPEKNSGRMHPYNDPRPERNEVPPTPRRLILKNSDSHLVAASRRSIELAKVLMAYVGEAVMGWNPDEPVPNPRVLSVQEFDIRLSAHMMTRGFMTTIPSTNMNEEETRTLLIHKYIDGWATSMLNGFLQHPPSEAYYSVIKDWSCLTSTNVTSPDPVLLAVRRIFNSCLLFCCHPKSSATEIRALRAAHWELRKELDGKLDSDMIDAIDGLVAFTTSTIAARCNLVNLPPTLDNPNLSLKQ